jgi:hypothetical protein
VATEGLGVLLPMQGFCKKPNETQSSPLASIGWWCVVVCAGLNRRESEAHAEESLGEGEAANLDAGLCHTHTHTHMAG